MSRLIAAALAASVAGFLAAAPMAHAQEEVEMTPTPTPTPDVPAMPDYQEPDGRQPDEAVREGSASEGVRIDRAGMFGAGFMIGNTSTGATAKLWFAPALAMQFSAGAGPLGNNIRFQLDVIYSYYTWEAEDGIYALPFYFGVGGQAGIFFKYPYPDDRTDLGVRFPVGMSVVIPDNPVELFFEVAPGGAVYQDSTDKERFVFYVDGQIGMRYYF